ncbi:DUF4411 family protein [Rhodothermus marinus]|uniref:DUF4411 family protein n=1 Tax=Rhodothermus marinus TaxID=29549 RepID=UPI0012BA4FD3|nr:DUF4411 family protein [Rhodothermus marinus]BBM69716.1 hypothetical protein RmaAA213_15620 [Rhodothermus marinus]BBM72701.1 hypothetical protein RmaAA338_15660 [Rhodothermus marinus]
MRYLLDANVFIAAKNLHYGMDFCPAFWDWLVESNQAGKVFSIEKVKDELEAGDDELAVWVSSQRDGFFLKPDPTVLEAMGAVSEWVNSNGYTPAAKNAFFQVADYWLIAHALAGGFVVVTHEKPADTRNKVKIPNVCVGLGIKVMTPFEMLRHERARFVLER